MGIIPELLEKIGHSDGSKCCFLSIIHIIVFSLYYVVMISFRDYAKIKDNYCLCYFGLAEDYLVQLKVLRPYLEDAFPGVNLYLGCKDESYKWFEGEKRIVKLSQLKEMKPNFAHVSEIKFNMKDHPIERLLAQSGLKQYVICEKAEIPTQKCVIITKSTFPTKPLEEKQVMALKRIAAQQGVQAEVDTDVKNAGMVMGVESGGLFQAASEGISTTLVPTGLGTRLYKSMFPQGRILEI